jgi:undecaprenyl phosphate-alpha-L-ara4N flippase subunit ArnE
MSLILLAVSLRSLAAFCAKKAALTSAGLSLTAMVFNAWFVAEIVVLFLQAATWAFVLRRHALSIAYPFMSLVFVLNLVMAGLVFGETICARHIVGIGIILVGVTIVALSRARTRDGVMENVST